MKFASTRLALLLALGGCQPVGPDYAGPPEVAGSGRFSGARDALPAQDLDEWWRRLGERELNRLVDEALACNLDLEIAAQRLREARAMRKQAAGAFLPRAGANLAFTRLDYAGLVDDDLLQPITEGGFLQSPLDYWSSGLDVSWEIDVFGGRRREARGARAREDAAREALHGTRLAVVAEVVETYLAVGALRDQAAILAAQVALQQSQSDEIRERVEAGAAGNLDLDRALARLETTRAELPPLEAGITGQLRRLALLLGQPSDALDRRKIAEKGLPGTLPMARAGLPGELLLRRPDLRQAERELAAATEEIGVAVANFYPKFTLGGGPSGFASSFANLFDPSHYFWQYGPRVDWAVFSAGANRAALESADARQRSAMLAYEKAVLAATGEVESELANLRAESQRLAIIQRARAATADAARRVRENHEAGATAYVDVLVEESALRELEITEVRVKSQMLQVWVRVHKALGGGWE